MSTNPRNQRRIERIHEQVDILKLLGDYGYPVRPDMDREQQFSCNMHGDGNDLKPSARVYPENNSWYCWACGKTRDAIETVREKEGLGFMEALKWLEGRFGLEPLPFRPFGVPTERNC